MKDKPIHEYDAQDIAEWQEQLRAGGQHEEADLVPEHVAFSVRWEPSTLAKHSPTPDSDKMRGHNKRLGFRLGSFYFSLWTEVVDGWGHGPAEEHELCVVTLTGPTEFKTFLGMSVEDALKRLSGENLIKFYEVEGKRYFKLRAFDKVPKSLLRGRRYGMWPAPDGKVPVETTILMMPAIEQPEDMLTKLEQHILETPEMIDGLSDKRPKLLWVGRVIPAIDDEPALLAYEFRALWFWVNHRLGIVNLQEIVDTWLASGVVVDEADVDLGKREKGNPDEPKLDRSLMFRLDAMPRVEALAMARWARESQP